VSRYPATCEDGLATTRPCWGYHGTWTVASWTLESRLRCFFTLHSQLRRRILAYHLSQPAQVSCTGALCSSWRTLALLFHHLTAHAKAFSLGCFVSPEERRGNDSHLFLLGGPRAALRDWFRVARIMRRVISGARAATHAREFYVKLHAALVSRMIRMHSVIVST
jgi:hypothetical protein